MIAQTPELADGGYWYVVPIVPDPDEGGKTPGPLPAGWCAWYGTEQAVVRTPTMMPGIEPSDARTMVVLIEAGVGQKPYGRVGGR